MDRIVARLMIGRYGILTRNWPAVAITDVILHATHSRRLCREMHARRFLGRSHNTAREDTIATEVMMLLSFRHLLN